MKSRETFLALAANYLPELWSDPIAYARGEYLLREGQIEQYIYLVQEGAVRAYYQTEAEIQTMRLGYTGNIINALPSFLSGKPSELSLQALKKTVVIRAAKADLMPLLKTHPEFLMLWNEMLESLFLDQFQREIDLLTASPEERYLRVLKRSPKVFQEVPHKYIAEYLRMTPETLSRLKKS